MKKILGILGMINAIFLIIKYTDLFFTGICFLYISFLLFIDFDY